MSVPGGLSSASGSLRGFHRASGAPEGISGGYRGVPVVLRAFQGQGPQRLSRGSQGYL